MLGKSCMVGRENWCHRASAGEPCGISLIHKLGWVVLWLGVGCLTRGCGVTVWCVGFGGWRSEDAWIISMHRMFKFGKDQNSGGNQSMSRQDSSKSKSYRTDQGKQHNKKTNTLGGYAGKVMIGDKRQPICIPAGMSKVVVGRTQGKLPKGSHMVKATDDNNFALWCQRKSHLCQSWLPLLAPNNHRFSG